MINHLRTLLLNSGVKERQPASYPGEEFVPEEFNPQVLGGVEKALLQALFGPKADRARKNYCLRTALGLLHAGELAPFGSELDKRITYPPFNDSAWLIPFSQSAATGVPNLRATQNPIATSTTSYWHFTITVTSSTNVEVYDEVGVGSGATDFPVTAGVPAGPIPLGDSGTSVWLTPTTGHRWDVELRARPDLDLPLILSAWESILGTASPEVLFGVDPVEPVLSWYKIWSTRSELYYRLPAAILGLGHRLESLRRSL